MQVPFLWSLPPTPLVALQLQPTDPPILCKLEFLNPSGSTKDRMARYMLAKAWRKGLVQAGSWVVEASSGSTSIALASACAQLGLRFLAVMPEGVSSERVLSIRAYGGEVLATPKAVGLEGAILRAEQEALARGGLATRQFENPDNPEAHRVWTAQEILAQIPGDRVDALVCGVGTGGTLVGILEGLTQAGCSPLVRVARPVCGRAVPDLECCCFSARIPGVVEDVSRIYQPDRLPGAQEVEVADEVALATARALIRRGYPVGASSGLNYAAAVAVARTLPADASVVTVFPDRMERYFSTELFQPYQELSEPV